MNSTLHWFALAFVVVFIAIPFTNVWMHETARERRGRKLDAERAQRQAENRARVARMRELARLAALEWERR